jgi:hypothetical protein
MDYKRKRRLSWLDYLLYSIRKRGLLRTCFMGYSEWRKEQQLGIHTFGTAASNQLSILCDGGEGGHLYQPSSSVLFVKAIAALPVKPEDSVFLDVGSGKGRVLVLAAEAGFKKAIGIEYAAELCDIAHVNIEKVRSRFSNTTFELHEGDAIAFGLPKEVNVVYLFNPFDEATLLRWIAIINQQIERRVHIIYMHPVFHEALMHSTPAISIVHSSPDKEFVIYSLEPKTTPQEVA